MMFYLPVAAFAAIHVFASPSSGFALGSPIPSSSTSHVSAAAGYPGYGSKIRPYSCNNMRSNMPFSLSVLGVNTGKGFGPALTIRGGAASSDDETKDTSDDSDSIDSEDTTTDDDDEDETDDDEAISVDAEVVEGPWANAAASASKLIPDEKEVESQLASAAAESQRSSYFLSSLLWTSIILDSILNKSKRAALFADAALSTVAGNAALRAGEAQQALVGFDGRLSLATAVPTAALAAGYGLAAGVALLLSRSIPSEDETKNKVATNIRQRLAIGLSLFGIINLFATAGSSPYLGMSGAVINGHNALVAFNGWSKDVAKERSYVGELISGIKDTVKVFASGSGLLRKYDTEGKSGRIKSVASAAFLLATFSALLRSVQTIRELQSSGVASVLSIAHLGRLVLAASVMISLKQANDEGRFKGLLVLGLGGLVSICSVSVAIPMMMVDAGMRRVTSDAGKLLLLSLFTGGLSLSKALVGSAKND